LEFKQALQMRCPRYLKNSPFSHLQFLRTFEINQT
jgi:hypothetical protein